MGLSLFSYKVTGMYVHMMTITSDPNNNRPRLSFLNSYSNNNNTSTQGHNNDFFFEEGTPKKFSIG